MSLVRYPIGDSPQVALSAPLGAAERASDAARLAGGAVEFVSGSLGAAFETREAALEAWRHALGPDQPWCGLRETVAPVSGRAPVLVPVQPSHREGRRWPTPPPPPKTVWHLCVTYWRPIGLKAEPNLTENLAQARKARRDPKADQLDAAALRAMAQQPLRAQRLQKGLDIGLFEVRAPEDPSRLIADE
jgi:hypothetical protein